MNKRRKKINTLFRFQKNLEGDFLHRGKPN
jgi:hypothetical protein